MLDKNILDIIKKMEYQVKLIKEAYDLLYNLDVENKKDTIEYEYFIKVVKTCLNLENKYISNLLTNKGANEVYTYLSKKYNMPIYFQVNPLDSEDRLLYVRTMNKMYIFLYKMMPKEKYAGFEFSSALYQLAINLDLLRLIIRFLDGSKEGLKIKYNLSFTIGEIEKELLVNNFVVDDNPYLTRNIFVYNDVLKNEGMFLTNNTIINTLRAYILSLFSFEKGFENDNNKYTDYLFVCVSIRACLVMFDSDTANLIIDKLRIFLNGEGDYNLPRHLNFNKDNLVNLLKDLKNSMEEDNARENINVLKELLVKYDTDRAIPRAISLSL